MRLGVLAFGLLLLLTTKLLICRHNNIDFFSTAST